MKEVKNNAVAFSKNLAGVVVALSLLSLGAYAAYEGRYHTSVKICAAGLLFAGAVNVIFGMLQLYRALMHKEA